MNNKIAVGPKELKTILQDFSFSVDESICSKINNLTSNLDKGDEQSISFYRLRNAEGESLFRERLSLSKSPIVIFLNEAKIQIDAKSVYELTEKTDFFSLQDQLIEKLYPLKEGFLVSGVTGTNGKTTVVHLCREIATLIGKKTFSIGTMGVLGSKGELLEDLYSTTPSRLDLRRVLYNLQDEYDGAFIEVSSHGLHQERLKNVTLSSIGWTNFTQDHLDYHGGMDEYFNEKCKIISCAKTDTPLLIPEGEDSLLEKLKNKDASYEIKISRPQNEWGLKNINEIFHDSFNKKNLELSLELVNNLWKVPKNISLETLMPPKGRFSILPLKNGKAIVDYAHTPDALKNICAEIKSNNPNSFFIVVFGCGGDRDPIKRPLMGKVASEYGDFCIITSDNPRSETPLKIIQDIEPGMDQNYISIEDRREAISHALKMDIPENKERIILIAGKGHEEYQEINNVKHDFSDFEVVKELLNGE